MKFVIIISWISIMVLMETTATPYKRTTDNRFTKTVTRRVQPTNEADKQTSSAGKGELDSNILFPEEKTHFVPVSKSSTNQVPVPKCSKGSTFCENVDEYPTLHVELLMKNSAHKYDELFGEDPEIPDNLMNRFNDDGEEESLCTSDERVVYPKMAQKLDYTWAYIINQPKYTQGVRIELCKNVSHKCQMTHRFPLGYDTKCKQKFIYRQLLALDENGRAEKTLIRLPSCCECVLIRGDIGRHGQ